MDLFCQLYLVWNGSMTFALYRGKILDLNRSCSETATEFNDVADEILTPSGAPQKNDSLWFYSLKGFSSDIVDNF